MTPCGCETDLPALSARDVAARLSISLLCLAAVFHAGGRRAMAHQLPVNDQPQLIPAAAVDSASPSSFVVVFDENLRSRRRRSAAVSGCPRSCTCQKSTALNCTVTSETDCLLLSLPVDTTNLKLTVRRIPPDNGTSARTDVGSASDCSKNRSSSRSSPDLTELRLLDLSGNELDDVNWFRFSMLLRRFQSSPLVVVSVADNRLQQLTNETFANISFATVETLDFSSNRIRQIEVECFHGFQGLQTLILSGNFINELDPRIFGCVPNLRSLYLDRNRLSSFSIGDVLASLHHLEILSLAGNDIKYVVVGELFPHPPGIDATTRVRRRLSRLDLSDNKFAEWPFRITSSVSSDDSNVSGFQPLDIRIVIIDGNPIRSLLATPVTPSGDDDEQLKNNQLKRVLGVVNEMSMSRMPELIGVDLSALANLVTSPEALQTVLIHDNRRLRYVDRSNDDKLISLRHLYLHNNNLTTVSRRVVSGLRTISLYGNPLNCDCNLDWFHSSDFGSLYSIHGDQLITKNNRTLLRPNETICARPVNVSGIPLSLANSVMPPSDLCSPVVIPLFDATTVLPLGSDLILDCRVVREKTADQQTWNIVWMTPDIVDRDRRINIRLHPGPDAGSTLTVRQLRARDAGAYRCRVPSAADSSLDKNATTSSSLPLFTQAQTVLRLYNVAAGVLPLAIGSRSATIVWNGTESTLTTADYIIIYRSLSAFPSVRPTLEAADKRYGDRAAETNGRNGDSCDNGGSLNFVNDLSLNSRTVPQQQQQFSCDPAADSGAILVRPFLRKYTVGGLQPNAVYEFCMMARIGRGGRSSSSVSLMADGLVRLSCLNITTRPELLDANAAIIGWFSGTLSVVCIAVIFTLICGVCIMARRRYRKRKWYGEPEMTVTGAYGDSVSVRLTSGLRRGPTTVATYGLPLSELRLDEKAARGFAVAKSMSTSNDFKSRSTECIVEHSPLSTSRTSLVGSSLH